MKRLDKTYEAVAEMIQRVDMPVHLNSTAELVPGECLDPHCWIENYAEGVARRGRVSKETAVKGISDAFDHVDAQANKPLNRGIER